jgi:hypothetical protein
MQLTLSYSPIYENTPLSVFMACYSTALPFLPSTAWVYIIEKRQIFSTNSRMAVVKVIHIAEQQT